MQPVNRQIRHYIAFESKRPRPRNSCPKCNSLDVRKRRDIYDYICRRCGWIGEKVTKIEY